MDDDVAPSTQMSSSQNERAVDLKKARRICTNARFKGKKKKRMMNWWYEIMRDFTERKAGLSKL